MTSYAKIIKVCGVDALAKDLGQRKATVRQWRRRNSIPAEHWHGVARLYGLTVLATYAEKRGLKRRLKRRARKPAEPVRLP